MKENQPKQILAMGIAAIFLLALPFFEEVYYKPLYYFALTILILRGTHQIFHDQKYEQRFYDKWQKKREQGFKINVAREGVKNFAQMSIAVFLVQFFVNGFTPFYIFHKLLSNQSSWLLIFLLGISLVLGIIAWNENEKKYARIHLEKVND